MNLKYYFDYNATTPTDVRVFKEIKPYFTENFYNPSSFYRKAGEIAYSIDTARERIARLLNCETSEIFFTSGGTESNNLAIFGTAYKLKHKGDHIITSSIEHPAIIKSCKYLEKNGFKVTYLPVDKSGMVDPDDLKKSIKNSTILITIMHANNEIGTIQPIKELSRISRENGILFHSDAVQSVGKITVNVKKIDIDMLSLSSHKIYGVKGTGVLYKRKGVKIDPVIFGGGHEKGLRAGTENVPGIVGTGKAAEIALLEMEKEEEKITPMKDKLQKELFNRIPELLLNSSASDKLYNTLNISVKYIEGESILAYLDQHGIALSSGSACSSNSLEPSHVLLAIGLKHEDAHGSLRISFGKYNTDEDTEKLIEVLPPIVNKLRNISPFWWKK